MKILTIGNSFTENALRYLAEIFESAGEPLTIGRCTIGGCTLETHWNNAESDAPVYGAYNVGDRTMRDLLESESWDVITLQQSSNFSWRIGTFQPYFDNLAAFCRTYAPGVKLYFYQTWAYRTDHKKLVAEHRFSQAQMFALIRENSLELSAAAGTGILPAGEALRIMQELTGDKIGALTRLDDGSSHCSPLGEYLAGLVWYGALGGDIDKIAFVPGCEDVSGFAEAAKKAAKQALSLYKTNHLR